MGDNFVDKKIAGEQRREMNKPTKDELIFALRCSTDIKRKDTPCESCRYYGEEEIPEKFKGMAEYKKDGKYYIKGCECDRICLDAAEYIENIKEGNNG